MWNKFLRNYRYSSDWQKAKRVTVVFILGMIVAFLIIYGLLIGVVDNNYQFK